MLYFDHVYYYSCVMHGIVEALASSVAVLLTAIFMVESSKEQVFATADGVIVPVSDCLQNSSLTLSNFTYTQSE